MTDLRYTVRCLLKKKGFTVVALVTIALGVGANTAIFSVVDGILLRPLPYDGPDRVVRVWQTNPAWIDSPNPGLSSWWDKFPVSYPVYLDWLELNTAFEEIGVYKHATFTVTGGERPERIRGARMTAGAFAALGVEPMLGRLFTPGEDQIGGPDLAVLSHGFWQRRFGSRPSALGETLVLDKTPFTVVGVMPPGFYFPEALDLWTTFDDEARQKPRDDQFLGAVARLRPGLSLERAQRDMEAVTARIAEKYPGEHRYGVRLVPQKEVVVGDVRQILLVLLGTVGAVLLIACANVANLLLVRATERRRELAVRAALGAGRGRLLGLVLAESMTLAAAGGTAGFLAAYASLDQLKRWLPRGVPRVEEVGVDFRVLLFTFGLVVLTGILVGALPALGASRSRVSEALGAAGRSTGGRRRHRAQALLTVLEIALAFLLLTGASLLATSFARLTSEERGFDEQDLLTLSVELPWEGPSNEELEAFYRDLTERFEAIPGVESVAATDSLPFGGDTSSGSVTFETPSGVEESNVERSTVTAEYFEVMRIPMIAGRSFSADDREGSRGVAVVSRAMAEKLWPGQSPVGRRVRTGTRDEEDVPWLEIVGVAGDVRHQGLGVEPRPKLYLAASQRRAPSRTFVLKLATDPSVVTAAARRAVWAVAPDQPVARVETMEALISQSVAGPRFRTFLIASLAAVAALLAIVGIYGVMAYAVAARTQEIGVRMALGARRQDVVRSVLARGLRLACLGLAVGLGLAAFSLRVLDSFLYRMSSTDPRSIAVVASVVAASAILASFLPARRAAAVDPVAALRQ